jgi:outer membrane receptor protein involved in Fe transport
VGNPDLKRTLIYNYDIRYELYPKPGELFALSAFYKEFNDPIIRAFNPRATIPELSFINVDEAKVLGAELEMRKSLSFLHSSLSDFYLSTNFAVIHSTYDIPQEEIESSKNIDPEYNETERPFQGQAPYIVNAILSYINPENGWEVALAYNVSGKRLYNISLFATPDVYERPLSMLNFKLSKKFADAYQVSFTAKNLLNAVAKRTHDFNGQEYIAESYTLGRTLGLSLTYQIK